MPGSDPFELPTTIVDAAMASLVGTDGEAQRRALANLVERFPHHGPALQALAATLAGADRVLARTFASAPVESPPEIDGYRVVRKIGEGAFGIVYLCEQQAPIRRQVAIKLLRPGAGDRNTLARFEAERSFLARLHHPRIAQIHDAGLLADGRPWFVMEHVPGAPITAYCDTARSTIERRLELFVRLCQGVQHAHEQGIVHRDLKPANVLVVDIDGEAQPKIIDFGIARALEQPAGRGEARTETGRVVGTPGYMSPEQMAGDLAAIDARSDLFSLGVMLYELLTGELPWGKRPTSTDSEPPRPSSRIGTATRQDTTVAELRASQPRRLAARLRGDLDWIVLKALSRAPADRYGSAAELAADILRHLRGEPVLAGPPSLRYRWRKFVRRHRARLATAAAIGALLTIGAWLIGGYRAEARSRTDDAEAAVTLLLARANDPALVTTPGSEPVRQVLARDALAFYDRFLQARSDDLPSRAGRARTLWTLAQVHWRLGEFARSEQIGREAVACSEALVAAQPDSVAYLRALANAERVLGRAIFPAGRFTEARACFQRAVDHLARCHAVEPRAHSDVYVMALVELESALEATGEHDAAADALQRASAIQAERVRDDPGSVTERDTLLHLTVVRARRAASRGDLPTARALLADAESGSQGASLPNTRFGLHFLAAEVALATGDRGASARHLERGTAVCREWIAKSPTNAEAHAMLTSALLLIADNRSVDEGGPAVERLYDEAITAADAWMQQAPEDPRARGTYVLAVHRLNRQRLTSGRRGALGGAESAARKANGLLAHLGQDDAMVREQHLAWTSLGTLGLIADALDLADAEAAWLATATAIADWRTRQQLGSEAVTEFAVYTLRISQRHLVAGRVEASQALLDDLASVLAASEATPDVDANLAELWRQRAVAAARRQDWNAARDAVDEARLAQTWRGMVAAGAAASEVWIAARAAGVEGTAELRDHTIESAAAAISALQEFVARDANDPWVAVPLAQARIRLARAERDRGDSIDVAALTAAVDRLASMRDEMHANLWDEELFRAGQDLLGR